MCPSSVIVCRDVKEVSVFFSFASSQEIYFKPGYGSQIFEVTDFILSIELFKISPWRANVSLT